MSIEHYYEVKVAIAKGIAASPFPYSAGWLLALPDGRRMTPDEYWETLSQEEKDTNLRAAWAAMTVLQKYSYPEVIESIWQEYLSQK